MRSKYFKIILYTIGSLVIVFILLIGTCVYFLRNTCWVADTVEIIDTELFAGKHLYLVFRVSGFQDKIIFYELYNEKPIFDNCGKANIEPISTIDLSDTKGHIKHIAIHDNALEIVYTENEKEGVEPTRAKLHINR